VCDVNNNVLVTNSAIAEFYTITVINTQNETKSSFLNCMFENWEEPTHKQAKKIPKIKHRVIHQSFQDMSHLASVTSSNYKD